jgi:hypothetical protein
MGVCPEKSLVEGEGCAVVVFTRTIIGDGGRPGRANGLPL